MPAGTLIVRDRSPLALARPIGTGMMGLASPSDRCNGPRSIVVVPVFSAMARVTKPRAVVPVTANVSDVPAAPVPVIASVPQDCAAAALVRVRNVARKRLRIGCSGDGGQELAPARWKNRWVETDPRGEAHGKQPAAGFSALDLRTDGTTQGAAGQRPEAAGSCRRHGRAGLTSTRAAVGTSTTTRPPPPRPRGRRRSSACRPPARPAGLSALLLAAA